LITTLKVKFGWDSRAWNPKTKKWYVWRDLEERLLDILKGIGYSVVWAKMKKASTPEKPAPEKPTSAPSGGARSSRDNPFKTKPFSSRPFDASRFASEFFGDNARSSRSPPVTPRPPAAPPNDYTLLEILPTARFEVAKAAYRALCLVHHTDRGGDNAKMVALNAAWERLCRKYGRTT
jgi:hypothetical protein